MKRRTKRRIFRGSLTLAIVGLVMGLVLLSGPWRPRPNPDRVAMEAAVRSCEAKVQASLRAPVARWQLRDEVSEPHGFVLTFAADVGGKAVTYRCEVTREDTTIAVFDDP
ncbi:hypothetical protein [Dyella jiangningensis]|uniref:hypothetical protein n=1 Tax=Dyella jiangningensis TaxID=1379159 RepID=UPI0011BDD1C0|nr:hypothetical protein [Dyella jiangningensis]